MNGKSGLDIMGIPTLFQSIANERKTGTLKIQNETEEKYIYFESGNIVQISSPQKPSILAEGLRRHPELDEDSYRAVCEEQRRTGQSLASLLLADEEDGLALVTAICQFQILEEVCELFTWQNYHSEFTEGDPDPMLFDLELMDIEPVGTEVVLLEAARRDDEWKVILEILPSKKDVPYKTEKAKLDVESLSQEEKIILNAIDGFRDIEDILTRVRLSPFSAMSTLAGLVKKEKVALKTEKELLQVAKLDVFREDIHKRIRLYERAIELGDQSREIKLWLANAYEAMGMRDKASIQYRELGYVCLNKELYPDSIQAFEKASQLNPEDLDAQERLVAILARTQRMEEYAAKSTNFARWLAVRGDKERAILLLREAVEKYPKNLENLDLLGSLYHECGYRTEAVNVYQELANLQIAQEDYEGAAKTYHKIILLDRENLEVRKTLGEILEKLGRTQESLEHYRVLGRSVHLIGVEGNEKLADYLILASQKIIDHVPDDLSARKWLAEAYLVKGEKEKAIKQLKEILERGDEKQELDLFVETLKALVTLLPEEIENRFKLAEIYLKMKREREAVQEYFAGGVAAAEMGKIDQALEAFDRLLRFDPANYATRLKKAEFLIQKEQKEKALEEFILTGYLSIGADKLWQAVKAFREALKLNRDAIQCYLELGKLYEKLGKVKEAVASYKKHVQKNVKTRNFGAALESCEAILKLEEDHEWAQKAKQKLLNLLPKIHQALQSN